MEVMQLLLLLLFRRRGSSLAWRRTKWEGRASHGGGGDVQEKNDIRELRRGGIWQSAFVRKTGWGREEAEGGGRGTERPMGKDGGRRE